MSQLNEWRDTNLLAFRKWLCKNAADWQRDKRGHTLNWSIDLLLPVSPLVSFFVYFCWGWGRACFTFLRNNFPLWLTASSQQTFVKESEIIPQSHVVLTTESHLFWKWTLISNAQTRQTHSGWHRETQKEALSFTSCLINPQPVVLVLLTRKENVSINTTDMLYFPYYND